MIGFNMLTILVENAFSQKTKEYDQETPQSLNTY